MKGQKYSSALILVFLLLPLQLTTNISHLDVAGEGEFQPFVERYLPEKGLLFYVSPRIRTTGDMDISVDIPSTRVETLRLDSWGGYSLGVIGKRITFYSRAVNHGDIPAYNVTASLTVYYWSGVGGIDRGEIVWSERKETYVPPGDGSLSPVITFNWTPEISGSFIINITFELRGDPRPRDNSAYYVGAVYEISGKRRYAGVWVDKWIDSLEGESDIICSPPSSWSKTPFPLGSSSGEYSPPTVFYTGDPSTLISNYNSTKRRLILPPFDLRDVPQDFYDPLYMRKKPQIYLGYKFLGDVRAGGFLRNLISVDGGPYEPLLDPLGNPIIISVNTTDEYGEYNWLCPTHVDLFGYDFYPGIEISRYAGHWVSIAIEYVPGSPDNGSEMGYFLDDFILFMRESYETFSFEVSPVSDEDVLVDPGSVSEVRYLVNFTRVKEVYPFRVYAEAPPTPQIHLIVSPEIIREPVEGERVDVSIFIKADITTPPGTYSTVIWFVGADETIKRTIDVRVPPFEKLLAEGGGFFHVLPGEEIQILCSLTNGGNVPLNLKSHLQSDMDIQAEYPGSVSLTPGERMKVEATITLNPNTPGNHTAYWIFYPEDVEGAEGLPPLALYQSLKEEGRAVGLITINIVVREVRDVFVGLLSRESLVVLKRTPQNVSIPMTVMNRGNTPERLSLSANLRGVEEGAVITKETYVLLDPGESTEVSIVLSLNSSTLHG
ncbi:MAG: hypothetical protein J7L88_00845, partial [Thermoplasmata archaeon]|nr:hypothetical protein [Thermoplasmata archaeon]